PRTRGRRDPRKGLGPVATSELLVAAGGSLGFLIALGSQGIEWPIVAALLIGGVIAAPLAAWLVSLLPARILAIAAGGIIVLTNARTILLALGTQPSVVWTVLAASAILWAGLLVHGISLERRSTASRAPEGASAALGG